MSIPVLTYTQGAELPDAALTWKDSAKAIIDFSSGHTFVLKIGARGAAATITKSAGITGAASAPNITVTWATSAELNTLAVGSHEADLIATRTSDSKQRVMPLVISITPPIT